MLWTSRYFVQPSFCIPNITRSVIFLIKILHNLSFYIIVSLNATVIIVNKFNPSSGTVKMLTVPIFVHKLQPFLTSASHNKNKILRFSPALLSYC